MHAKANNGNTPLHDSGFAFGQTEIVIALIDRGADIHAKGNKDGQTPLHWAASQGQTETAVALIDRGADIHATANLGRTPLHLATSQGETEISIALIDKGALTFTQETSNGLYTPALRLLHIRSDPERTSTLIDSEGAYIHAKHNARQHTTA